MATPTGTVTPTEAPPEALQQARYWYDGDGNMVKSVVNEVVTYYVGGLYQKQVDGSTVTVQKFYAVSGQKIAMRTVEGQSDTLKWILTDHLGSASITANADGTWNSELRYTAFGEVRYSSGITPTEYRYTGQLEQAEIGLYYYGARWYDTVSAHFVQADTIVPSPGNPMAWDRYAYVLNNPLKYTDPTGHANDAGGGGGAPDKRDLTIWFPQAANYMAKDESISTVRKYLSVGQQSSAPAVSAVLIVTGELKFYNVVKDGARFDVKDEIKRQLDTKSIKLGDNWYEYSTPGNILYGFYGAAAGNNRTVLHAGAGVAQTIDYAQSKLNIEGSDPDVPFGNYWLDTKDDYYAIELGYYMYQEYYMDDGELTHAEFLNALDTFKHLSELNMVPAPIDYKPGGGYAADQFDNR